MFGPVQGETDAKNLETLSAYTLIHGLGAELPLGNLIMQVAQEGGLTKLIMRDHRQIAHRTNYFEFSFTLSEEAYILNSQGDKRFVKKVSATITFKPNEYPLSFNVQDFNGQAIATAVFKDEIFGNNKKKEGVATISSMGDSGIKMTVLSSDNLEIDFEIQPEFLITNQ